MNSSEDSDQTLTVLIEVPEGNGRQLEIRQLAFNRLETIEGVDISGVNALRVRLHLDDATCSAGDEVFAVIEDLIVS